MVAGDPRPRLRALDPTAWDTGLSDAGARAAWAAAVEGLTPAFWTLRPEGPPPRRVVIIASANVFTAPLPWLVWLSAQAVPVLLKPARGQLAAARAIAAALPGVEVRPWAGGDPDAEAEALAGSDAVIVYGRAETIAAVRARAPVGVRVLGFGPRFGVGVGPAEPMEIAFDLAMYDSRGCMSPAAWLLQRDGPSLEALAAAMADAEARWPRGRLAPDEGPAIRSRLALGRVLGRVLGGGAWSVVELPLERFSPVALPRCLVVHRYGAIGEVAELLRGHVEALGTIGGHDVGWLEGWSELTARVCAPGAMQRPVAGRVHDGVDVVAAVWGARDPGEGVGR